MSTKGKKILGILGIVLLVTLGVASLVIVPRIAQIRELIAPTAPESRPAAAEWLGGASCNLTFKIKGPKEEIDCATGLSDNFDGEIAAAKWQTNDSGNVNVRTNNGILRVKVDGGQNNRGGGLTSKKVITGDFVVEVDMSDVDSNMKDLGVARLQLRNQTLSVDDEKNNIVFERQSVTSSAVGPVKAGKLLVKGKQEGVALEEASAVLATTESASLKLERAGATVTAAYRLAGGEYQVLKQYTDWFSEPLEIRLRGVSTGQATPDVTAKFDNFVLACAATTPTPTPTPTEPAATPTPTPTEPAATPTPTPTQPAATPTPTPTPTTGGGGSTSSGSSSTSSGGFLPTPTPTPTASQLGGQATPTPTRVAGATPTPTGAQLPEAGIGLPTLGALGGGIIMILLGILLAL